MGERKIHANIVKSIWLYIENNYDCDQKLLRDVPFRFPLFDQYLYHWLEQKSFSSCGKFVVYFSEDIKGIIIGNPVGGEIFRVISLPGEMADRNFGYFYNEYTQEFMVVSPSNDIRRYIIGCNSKDAINNLNYVYEKAFTNNINLATGDMSFTNILYRAMNSCTCEPVGFSRGFKHNDNNSVHITLSVKTSISGKVVLKHTALEIGCLDCDKKGFENTFEFDISQESFGIILVTNSFEKEIFLRHLL